MTNRDRFLAALNGKPQERMPVIEWATWWDQTVKHWESEGLPPQLGQDGLFRFWGLDSMLQHWIKPTGPGCPKPAGFGQGIISSAEDYEAIRQYLYQDVSIERLRDWMMRVKARHDSGASVVWLTYDGFFWLPRSLFGIEQHFYAFYDEPELMHRINRDHAEFCLRATEAACDVFAPDFMTIAEDMSYNHGPMLSRSLFDEFIAPYYKMIVPALQKRGVHVLIDTDGNVEQMIPWLRECGIEGVLPLERQAGVDVERIRRMYPDWIMIGGYDKTVMHLGEEAMRREFERLLPTMRSGRYIASVDHQTPPDVSMENYRIYMRLLMEYAEKAAAPA